jgi:hypothetical protein
MMIKKSFKLTSILLVCLLFSVMYLPVLAYTTEYPEYFNDQKLITNPPKYQFMFFRHDGKVWIELPQGTTLVEIYPSTGNMQGWVQAVNRWRQPLAVDNTFHGDAVLSTYSGNAAFPNKIVTSTRNGKAVGIHIPAEAKYVEIINEQYGFDGSVRVFNKDMKVIARQAGLDIRVTSYR